MTIQRTVRDIDRDLRLAKRVLESAKARGRVRGARAMRWWIKHLKEERRTPYRGGRDGATDTEG
jgi:hypothetical protein